MWFWIVKYGIKEKEIFIVCAYSGVEYFKACSIMASFLWLGSLSSQLKSPLQFESARKAYTSEVSCRTIEVQFKHARRSEESRVAPVCADICIPGAGGRYGKAMAEPRGTFDSQWDTASFRMKSHLLFVQRYYLLIIALHINVKNPGRQFLVRLLKVSLSPVSSRSNLKNSVLCSQ